MTRMNWEKPEYVDKYKRNNTKVDGITKNRGTYLVSKFNGICSTCGLKYAKGEYIIYNGKGNHPGCL